MTQARDLGDAANKANFLDNVSSDIQTQVTANATALTNAILPAGLILPFGNTSAPTGYLACHGQAVSRTTYATLFAAIGTTWGTGDGSTTFNVPDFRGAIPRGTGSHGTNTMANGSAYAGPSVGSFENDQMQGHEHRFTYQGWQLNTGYAGGKQYVINDTSVQNTPMTTNQGAITDGTNGTPRTGDETRPFTAGVLWCIKT